MDKRREKGYAHGPMVSSMRLLIFILSGHLMAGATLVSAQSGGDAGDLYFKGYLQFNESERMEKAGDLQNSYQKLLQAQQNIGTVARTYPSWQPEIVSYRLKMIEQALQRLSGASAPAVPANPMITPNTTGGVLIPNAHAPTGIANPLDIINQQFQALQKQNAEMQSKLKLYEDGYTNALNERQKSEKDRAILSQQLQDINQRMDKLAKDAAAKITGAEQELQKLQNEAKMVSDMMASRDRQLAEKDKAIASLQSEMNGVRARQKQLEDENASLKANNVKPDDYNKIMAENTRLKQELEVARQQVDVLKASGEKKDQEIATLKTQITGIQSDLAQLRQENNVYQSQVADLTVKLKELDAATAEGKTAVAQASKLTTDNAMLRNIIMRDLRQQERQRQAKELVIAEMKKMENASAQLMEHLEDMTSAKINLTIDEEPLFAAPELKEIIEANGVRATLMAVSDKTKDAREKKSGAGKDKPKSSASVSEEKMLAEAIKAEQKGDIKSAEQSYQDALRANPKNTTVLNSLAALKQQQKKYEDAKVLLQKCLVYDPDNSEALYRLGICQYQQGNLPEAMTSFEKCLVKNGANSRAHHYLGIIANRMKNQQRAESEFKQALAIDPENGDAHFNLAVLYATLKPPDLASAQKHYKDALDRGIKSDAALEKLLNKADAASGNLPKGDKSTAAAQ